MYRAFIILRRSYDLAFIANLGVSPLRKGLRDYYYDSLTRKSTARLHTFLLAIKI